MHRELQGFISCAASSYSNVKPKMYTHPNTSSCDDMACFSCLFLKNSSSQYKMWERLLMWELLNHQPASAAGQGSWRCNRCGLVSISYFKQEKQYVDVCDNDQCRRNTNPKKTVMSWLCQGDRLFFFFFNT